MTVAPPARRAAVVGGGVGGASAALRLARAGVDVVLTERSDHLGGLVGSLDVGGTPIERFYHHIFPHEHEVIGLITALGLGDRLAWFRSSVGMLTGGRLWPFTSPLDLLRFSPLPLVDRVHTGVGALRCARWGDWEPLDGIAARDWLVSLTGRRGTEVVWDPLLRAKFGTAADRIPAAWMLGRFQQRAAARQRGVERLGYLRGGFRQLFDALEAELGRQGVRLALGTSVSAIRVERGQVVGVDTDGGPVEVDTVIYAGSLPGLPALVPEAQRDPRWGAVPALGAIAVVVELRRRVTDTYWVNVCDADLPLTAYIEHTNLVPPADYGGRHLAYLARYFTADDPLATGDMHAEAVRWVDALADGGLPGLQRDDVLALHPSRTSYAAPLLSTGHLARIPPVRSHIAGLYVATTAQIYPQDRGMSEGVRLGTEAANHAIADARGPAPERRGAEDTAPERRGAEDTAPERRGAEDTAPERRGAGGPAPVAPEGTRAPDTTTWACPVCGGREGRVRYGVDAGGSEGGVSAEAFRPSSERFGRAWGTVVACVACGHGSVERYPPAAAVTAAYADAVDPVSLREEAGQVATAERAFERIEAHVRPGRFADIGCWTGSMVEAGCRRGWDATGVEPSAWASSRARERGLDVRTADLADHGLAAGAFRAVSLCDVVEHLEDPGAAVEEVHRLLEPGGALYLTVPDAGSAVARALGRRWWSVLPMHLQHFTRSSMRRMLGAHGFRVVAEHTHAKSFTARYYAERLGGYRPAVGAAAVRALEAVRLADDLVAPNLGDRLEVIAVSR